MPTRILIASIGNPPPHALTLHSAGHVLSHALLALLGSDQPAFAPSASPRGLLSSGPTYTLYQSPSQMNASGTPIAATYRAFVRTLDPAERSSATLVVLHDELESPLGKIKVKVGGSARGHNGIKDIGRALGGAEFVRIGVGIGRPASRDSRDVGDFVLRKMTAGEMARVRDGAGEVLKLVERMRAAG